MKQIKFRLIFSALFISLIFLVGCESDEDDDKVVESSYERATITHLGFDFSEGKKEESPQLWDGSVQKWQPGNGEHATYINLDKYLWWNNSGINNGISATKYVGGGVDLASIKSVTEGDWDSNPTILPLLENTLYVAKCRDGYVKFKVISTSPDSIDWEVEVDYYFSTSATFDK